MYWTCATLPLFFWQGQVDGAEAAGVAGDWATRSAAVTKLRVGATGNLPISWFEAAGHPVELDVPFRAADMTDPTSWADDRRRPRRAILLAGSSIGLGGVPALL